MWRVSRPCRGVVDLASRRGKGGDLLKKIASPDFRRDKSHFKSFFLYYNIFNTVAHVLRAHTHIHLPSYTTPQIAIMGGGGGKPQNIFKLNRGDDPKEVLNWRLWFAVLSFGIMGAARGMFHHALSRTQLANRTQVSTKDSSLVLLRSHASKNS